MIFALDMAHVSTNGFFSRDCGIRMTQNGPSRPRLVGDDSPYQVYAINHVIKRRVQDSIP